MNTISELLKGDTQNFGCQIMEYTTSLSQLYIKVTTGEAVFYLTFIGTRYIESPMAWNNATFKLNNHDDKIKFMLSKRVLQDLPIEAMDELFNLYTIESVGVKIVASNVVKSNGEPT